MLFLTIAGCGGGPSAAELTGKVTFKGKPLVTGQLAVICDDGRVENCTIEQGRYTIPRAPVGLLRVGISGATYQPAGVSLEDVKQRMKKRAQEATERGGPKEQEKEKEVEDPGLVPSKYTNPQTSGLTVEVKPGAVNHQDFNLP